MARTVKDYDERRSEILAVANRLFHQKGFEQTSVQEIIDEIGIAKGTFYHYFGSKIELLDAIIAQMTDQILQVLDHIIEDEALSALQKLEAFFLQAMSWKITEKDFLIKILPVWYRDENAILREKIKQSSIEHVPPILAKIINQGVAEGVFSTPYPFESAEIIMQISLLLSDTVGRTLLTAEHQRGDEMTALERRVKANRMAVENLLNAAPGSVKLFDFEQIQVWFT